jgi:carboxypeptidase C (cathepsin A)
MTKLAAAVFFLLVVLGPAGLRAEDKPAGELPARVTTHHDIALAGQKLAYDATAETFELSDAKGTPTASVFTVSYVAAAPGGGERPVTFAFNGGPGAASVFLHLGALGPRIMDSPANGAAPAPPVHLIDNPSTWLAFTDLVFVDPVGTGFSRGLGKEENPDNPFWDVHADLASLGAVVRLWLTRHQRWAAPIYLVGESYGGFRAATLAQTLPRDVNVTPSGLVLVSPALDLSMLRQNERDLLAAAFPLPSYAATANALGRQPARDLAKVEKFALSDYLVGLAGLSGQISPSDPFIAEIAGMTGLPAEIVRRQRGRVPRHVFAREIRRAEGETVSLYDATVARPAAAGDSGENEPDPVLQPTVAAYGAAFNAYVADALGYRTDRPYRVLAHDVSRHWNWQGARREGGPGLALSSLETALLQHPQTRVLIVNGRYDLVTPYFASRWLADQLDVPQSVRARVRIEVYEGGHMMYMRPASRAALAHDAAQLYATSGATPPSQ